MPAPLAYFLTWTCHGTWLHGDPRGSVDRLTNERFAPRLAPKLDREAEEVRLMPDSPIELDDAARAIVDTTIRKHCELRDWRLLALNVRTNHVHVVVKCPSSVTPEDAMSQFKAWSTRRLLEAGLVPPDRRVWTEHGSTRWIDSAPSLAEVIDYVCNQQ